MKECTEHVVNVGFKRSPKKVFDEIDSVTASMIREGWVLKESFTEDCLGHIHLFFERILDISI